MKLHELLPVIALIAGYYFYEANIAFLSQYLSQESIEWISGRGQFQFGVLLFSISYPILALAYWIKHKTLDTMSKVTIGLIVVMAIPGIIFGNSDLFKWKTSIIYWSLSGFLAFTLMFKRDTPILAKLMKGKAIASPLIWNRITLALTSFLAILGCANLYVALNTSDEFWINFKVFGVTGMIFFFIILTLSLSYKHIEFIEPESK
jgi:intracellular septation protein